MSERKPERIPLSKRKLLPPKESASKVVLIELRCPRGILHDLIFDDPDEIIEKTIAEYIKNGWTYEEPKD
jgi:hypothetical protein